MDWLQLVATLAGCARKVSMLRTRYKRSKRVTRALSASVATARASLSGFAGGEGEIAHSVLDPLLVQADDILSKLRARNFHFCVAALVLSDDDDDVTTAWKLIDDLEDAREKITIQIIAHNVRALRDSPSQQVTFNVFPVLVMPASN
ncbi:hypothetical protein AURDEDRAFT_164967 [Auricularia subglabra TFB-10046 SS5]|nr:hypothetical protein AURDEDRAFT_164967 [Auricularia subglabra TFB-10046 SS5]